MRVTFFSNYLNAHMLPLCLALNSSDDVDFAFVALSGEPGDVGRPNLNGDYDFVIRSYENEEAAACARERALGDEVVVFGHMGGDESLVKERMSRGLLTFRQAERTLKRGKAWRFFPLKARRTYDWFLRYCDMPYYVLCAGAYAAYDLVLARFPAKQCLTWGYYPGNGEVELGELARNPRMPESPLTLLWAGRMISWKHPESAIELAEYLDQEGRDFRLTMIGDGPLREPLCARAVKAGLESRVRFAGQLGHRGVLELMRKNDVLLFTSDRREGWGVTLSEAMAQGCAVVANTQAGSSLSLVDDGVNGLLYDGTQHDLRRAVSRMFEEPDIIEKLGTAAHATMSTVWSAESAAANLLKVSRAFLDGRPNPVKEGPCSPAPLLSEGWSGGD